MQSRIGPLLQGNEHSVHQRGIRSASESMLLRTAHFRRSHHLHRFGELADVTNRFDPAANVLRACHIKKVGGTLARPSFRGAEAAPTLFSLPGRFEILERALELRLEILIELSLLPNRAEQTFLPG